MRFHRTLAAPLFVLASCTILPTDAVRPAPSAPEAVAQIDVSDGTRFLPVRVLGPDGGGLSDVTFSLRAGASGEPHPLFVAQRGPGDFFIGLERGDALLETPLFLEVRSRGLGARLIAVDRVRRSPEVRFEPPGTLTVRIDGERIGSYRVHVRGLDSPRWSGQVDRTKGAIFADTEADNPVTLAPLQPGLVQVLVTEVGTRSSWTNDDAIVARADLIVDSSSHLVVLDAQAPRSVEILYREARPSASVKLQSADPARDPNGGAAVTARVGEDRRATFHGLISEEYLVSDAAGGVPIHFRPNKEPFEFTTPPIVGIRVTPTTPGADISPFRTGDVIVRLNQGPHGGSRFQETFEFMVAVGPDVLVSVVNDGQRRSFRISALPRGASFAPVSAF